MKTTKKNTKTNTQKTTIQIQKHPTKNTKKIGE